MNEGRKEERKEEKDDDFAGLLLPATVDMSSVLFFGREPRKIKPNRKNEAQLRGNQ